MESANLLIAFVRARRPHFEDPADLRFAYSVGHATEYAEYLEIIAARYKRVNAEYLADLEAEQAGKRSEGGAYVYDRDRRLELTRAVHFEIESFYVFAKTLLDRIAMNFQYLFGPPRARGIPIGSHHQLIDHLAAYAEDRGLLLVPAELLPKAVQLQARISDYRDDEITHANNPRVTKGMSIVAGFTRIHLGRLLPTPHELAQNEVTQSATPIELGADLDAYLRDVIAYLDANVTHARGYVGPADDSESPAPGAADVPAADNRAGPH